ncbi:hypothetical protein [Microbacterium cremeum]|uniref:hypothetical protein n=1 Tax=Microbacterium cremeum TaxID=2782169 RepID=UPI001887D79D|nr:hypothetical protein [Microbacterium cremeum]
MKRIDIYYGGEHYSVGGRDPGDVTAEILQGIASGPRWLEVNDGWGEARTAYLLLSAGVPVAVVPIPDEYPGPALDGDDTGADAD